MFKLFMLLLTLPSMLFLLSLLLIKYNLFPWGSSLNNFGYFLLFAFIGGIVLPVVAILAAIIHYLLSRRNK